MEKIEWTIPSEKHIALYHAFEKQAGTTNENGIPIISDEAILKMWLNNGESLKDLMNTFVHLFDVWKTIEVGDIIVLSTKMKVKSIYRVAELNFNDNKLWLSDKDTGVRMPKSNRITKCPYAEILVKYIKPEVKEDIKSNKLF